MKTHHRKVPRYRLEVNLRQKDSPAPWKWEIYADGDRLFVAQSESGFAGRDEALAAGEQELQRWQEAARTGNGKPSRPGAPATARRSRPPADPAGTLPPAEPPAATPDAADGADSSDAAPPDAVDDCTI